jgi:glycosyltransferase involved in cell wall biosynthesis
MKVQLLVRRYKTSYGISRYTATICKALADEGAEYSLAFPKFPYPIRLADSILGRFGLDVEQFFSTYPLITTLGADGIVHLTDQQMSTTLYLDPPRGPVVTTVHDIVPYLVRGDPEQSTFRHPFDRGFDALAMRGLKRADHLIAISQYTKKTLVDTLSIPQERISVILYGVDHETFRPLKISDEFRQKYELPGDNQYVVYVGAESPRKNLPRLVRAFAQVKAHRPSVKLIKVGTPTYLAQFQQLKRLIGELGLENDVLFINHPPEQGLVAFYNLADVFVFPSLYEGFGMPPLEALACGAPVVSSNATSLPEVVGDAAIQVDPYNTDELAEAIDRVLSSPDLQVELSQKGRARAATFDWSMTAKETLAIYRKLATR